MLGIEKNNEFPQGTLPALTATAENAGFRRKYAKDAVKSAVNEALLEEGIEEGRGQDKRGGAWRTIWVQEERLREEGI